MPSKAPVNVYQLKVTLKRTKLSIWRRVEVPCDITLERLHDVIQVAMGWMDEHLHEFVIGDNRYGEPASDELDFGEDLADERRARLNKVAAPGAKFEYCYDFGDGWVHEIQIEREIAGDGKRTAHCLAGKNACPPEDCGGPSGYDRILAILAKPKHEEYEETLEWIGEDVDPRAFDAKEVDLLLALVKV